MKKYLLLTLFLPLFSFGQQNPVCDTISDPSYPDTIFYCVTDASCYGSCDGELEINIFGPNAPYRFIIGTSSDTLPNGTLIDTLCPSGYSILVLDNNNDNVDVIFTSIASPSEILIYADDVVDPNCFGADSGFINISTFGDSPFTWSWNNGYITEDISGLESGTYVVTTTDSNGCSRIDPFTLEDPLKVNSITITDTLSCIDLCDGEAIVIPSDGVAPYTYQWSDINGEIVGATNDTAYLCYGINTVEIEDANGCLDTNEVFIENPDTLKLSNITIDSSCYQICDGEISVTIEGGKAPYDTEWSLGGNIFNTTDTITLDTLCPGDYQLIYTDANDCSDTVTIPLIERDSFFTVPQVTPVSCYNSCTGEIIANLFNQENPPFIYNWNWGNVVNVDNDTLSNLCSGFDTLEIIDARGCRDTFYYFIDEPPILSFDTAIIQHNDCYGESIGSIILNISGGTGLISIEWTASNNYIDTTNQDITNLFADDYTIHIQDQNLCSIDTFYTVNQPDTLVGINSVQPVSCKGYSDGIIDILIQGGTYPYYTITWDVIIEDTNYVDSLAAGWYVYTIIDTNGCQASDSVQLDEPDELVAIDTITNVLCKGYHEGAINLTVSGGTPGYSYAWTGPNGFTATTKDINGLASGTYTVLITDQNACVLQGTYNVSDPVSPITFYIDSTNDVSCNGLNDGAIYLTVSGGTPYGGTPSYDYLWSNAETTEDISNLVAGTYTVSIIDSNGCDTISQPITITEPSAIILTDTITDLDCFEDGTGSIAITTAGGISPYSFSWDNGETTEDISNLMAGNYLLTVTDNNNCEHPESFSVGQPDLLVVVSDEIHVDCFGNSTGAIDITVSGGTQQYTFDWSNLSTAEDLQNVPEGFYEVTVTDAKNCSTTVSATINQPTEIEYLVVILDLVCNNIAEGEISITTTGGTPAYSYSINGGSTYQSSSSFTDLEADNYSVWIKDANGCEKSEGFVINQPSPFLETANVNSVNPCNGDATGSIDFSVVGNTFPYTYQWSNNATSASIANLTAGNYTVDVTDAKGCDTTYSYLITEPDALLLDYTVKPASCEEKDDGAIYASATGGIPPISYDWSNGEEGQDILDLSKGIYSLQVEDANGCTLALETIEVNFDGFDGCIEIPSGFTPNYIRDGIHDEWNIYGLYDFPDVVVKVYNRWGQEMYSSKGYEIPWDGKYQGADLPTATYYYVIQLTDSGKVFNGTVTIKR